ncbi:MAG: CNNM domain-containing protein [Planctomycetota bacterium]
MSDLILLAPWLITMMLLIGCSCFFSASEAALFSLRPSDRRSLRNGTRSEQAAYELLGDPDRLLSAVLFWNLVINISFFAISSMVAIRLEKSEQMGQGVAVAFAGFSLLGIIFFSELLPKSFAVLRPRTLTQLLSLPLSLFVRLLDPVMPLLQGTNLITRRLFFPTIEAEPYLGIQDLERAIEITGSSDASVIRQEQAVLQNIVQLSSIRVDEWMRPRTQFDKFQPPVGFDDLGGRIPPSGYLLVTEPGSEEIEKAIRLDNHFQLPEQNIERLAEPVLYLPWCSTVADALEKLSHKEREVAVIVNEYGETIGVLTIEDILETVFNYSPSRSKRILDQNPIHPIHAGKWVVAGMVSLNYLAREMSEDLLGLARIPETHCVTVGGVIQEEMQRLAEPGDVCSWGPFRFHVIEVEHRGNMLVELTLNEQENE